MISRAYPPRAGTTVTLGAHNIAFFFVLASRTRKNTSTPPPHFSALPKFLRKHTLMNIICILEPLPDGSEPPIPSALEGRHFSALGLSKAGSHRHCINNCRSILP